MCFRVFVIWVLSVTEIIVFMNYPGFLGGSVLLFILLSVRVALHFVVCPCCSSFCCLCCVFVLFVFVLCFVYPMLPIYLHYPFLIAPTGFSNVLGSS